MMINQDYNSIKSFESEYRKLEIELREKNNQEKGSFASK